MSLIKLSFKPGVNRDQTSYAGEGGWYESEKVRFRSGYPEKIGGWQKSSPYAVLGVCRQLWNYATSYGDRLVSIGTQLKLYLELAGYFYDITPLRQVDPTITTPDTDNAVATTNGSTTVVLNLGTTHNLSDGQYVTISGVTGTVGGVPDDEINANHEVTVIDSDSFSIEVSTAASSTAASGGGTAIVIDVEIEPGYALDTAGYGWGAGGWSRDAWGLGSTGSPINLPQRDWFFDNFYNDLVGNIRDGAAYIWERGTTADPSTALATRAISLIDYANTAGFDANAVPVKIMQLMTAQDARILVAFGAVPYGSTAEADYDPMLIRWTDQDEPGQWTPEVTNSAGDYRLSRGSHIVRAMPVRQETLVWTDSRLYSMQFLGTTDVFSFQEYAEDISIISPRACALAAGTTYWMGQDKFYAYSGRVETLPCTLRNHVFQDLNYAQQNQIICGTNEEWNEIWWFYPSDSSQWNDKYVVYNHLERIWYYGSLARTSWMDTSLRDNPIATSTTDDGETSYMYNHEDGIDDDGAPMEAYIQSSDFDLGDGDQFMLTRRIIPDVNFSGSTATNPEVTLSVRARVFPGTGYQDDDADSQNVVETSVDRYTGQVFVRARGRQMALKVSSDGLGTQWQIGAPRLDLRPDGKSG